MTVTRNYGDTAKEKSNELLWHMLIAVISVSVLIAITLGLRESLIVFIAIPVTLALTLTVFYLYGYTLNRITLFALIFSIGILVDDAIVVVENIVRHWRMPANQDRPPFEVAIEAVDEVGNPTILATLAVVAAILPMAFVGGLMGPYMRPIPIGASAAMLFSLLVAFIVTPWAAVRILKPGGHHEGEREDFVTRLYRRFMGGLLHRPVAAMELCRRRGGLAARLLLAVLLRLRQGQDAAVRQQERVPGDRRHAERHHARRDGARDAIARRRNAEAARSGERPDLRGNGVALQLQRPGAPLLPAARAERRRHSGESAAQRTRAICKATRSPSRCASRMQPIAERYGARIKVAEVPPGPPVLETLVAEVYGPSMKRADRAGPADARSVQTDQGRCRCRLVRGRRSAEVQPVGRRGKGRPQRHLRRTTSRARCRWLPPAMQPACCIRMRRRKTFRSPCGWTALRAPIWSGSRA